MVGTKQEIEFPRQYNVSPTIKKKKAPSVRFELLKYQVIPTQFNASRRGKKELKILAIKMHGTSVRTGEGGEQRAMWPRIWATTININKSREREKAKIINGNGEKKRKTKYL